MLAGSRARRHSRRRGPRRVLAWSGALRLGCGRAILWRRLRSGSTFRQRAEHRADGNGRALRHQNFRKLARRRRRHLDRDLVGFELAQCLVGLDRFARLPEPLADGCLGDAFAERGYLDLDAHRRFSILCRIQAEDRLNISALLLAFLACLCSLRG